MSLKEILCQDKAISILQRALAADRMSHAYIFAGPEGVGRFTTAREWAKLLLCHSPKSEAGQFDSCGSCESCRLFVAGSHPDFHHIYKELLKFTEYGKGKETPVDLAIDVVREFVIGKAISRPALSGRRVFIIDEAEKLNVSSQNCLLKVLEEPPQYCCLILVCTRLENLLPTIKSRSQMIRFGPVDAELIAQRLEATGLEQTTAEYFARLSAGSLGLACRLAELEQADAQLYQTKKRLINALAAVKLEQGLDLAQWLCDQSRRIAGVWAEVAGQTSKTDINRRAAKTLVRMVICALHDAMSAGITPDHKPVNFDQPEQIARLAERFGPEALVEKIFHAYRMLRWIESSVNERLVFEELLLNFAVSDRMSTLR